MVIKRIEVRNFRLLQDFRMDLQNVLSLVVGKNNSGKTSLLKVMDKFLNTGEKTKFVFEDFTLAYHADLEKLFDTSSIDEDKYVEPGIFMRIFIQYDDKEDLEYVSPLCSIEEGNNYIGIEFAFALSYTLYIAMRKAYSEFIAKEAGKKKSDSKYNPKTWEDFLKTNLRTYFKLYRRSLPVDSNGVVCDGNVIDLQSLSDVFKLDNVLSFKYIDARRSVDNKEPEKTLSAQSSVLFRQMSSSDSSSTPMENLGNQLRGMDDALTEEYKTIFKDIEDVVRQFGGMQPDDTVIKIISNLEGEILLRDHTRVVYEDNGKNLPESHNGLGYMNLISMLFEIESIRNQFARVNERKPADINLLFIEEPEAHTHPQMQYVFIKNIKSMLERPVKGKGGVERKVQAIITTHSSHIVSECDFDDVRYLKREKVNGVISKNLTTLEKVYKDEPEWYKFLKQYITLDRSELFFADKAIFVEGDTERILLPTMMKMVDEEVEPAKDEMKLTSQNISIISVGNYTQVFTKFFNFIGFKKICVITDIDICEKVEKDKDGKKTVSYQECRWEDGKVLYTTNSSLKYYFDEKKLISDYRTLDSEGKRLSWDIKKKKWQQSKDGNMMVCYQTDINGYLPRSFEDAFFETNKDYICADGKVFRGLREKALNAYKDSGQKDSYELAEKGISSKATFAVDLLIDRAKADEKGYVGWSVPDYIKEGLLWIRKD